MSDDLEKSDIRDDSLADSLDAAQDGDSEAAGGLPSDQPDPSDPSEPSESAPASSWDDDPAERIKRLEAVLFLSKKPLASRKISDLAHLEDGTQARTMIGQLNSRYDRSGQAFHIKRVAGGYQMLTRPQFSDWIRRLEHVPKSKRLSAPAMETLTVVAYRQPIIKAEIEAIRGVSCGEMLRQLLENNMVKIAGRSEKLGRPFLYSTTKAFLAHFGLNSLQELPRSKQLSGTGLPQWAVFDDNQEDAEDPSKPLNDETIKETQP